jgi:hypothetical protein
MVLDVDAFGQVLQDAQRRLDSQKSARGLQPEDALPAASLASQVVTDFLVVQRALEAGCGRALEASLSSTRTVEERLAAANGALACVKEARSALRSRASTAEARAVVDEVTSPALDKSTKVAAQAATETDFMGLKWGLAFGYSYAFDDLADDAAIVNGVVRVKRSVRQQPRVLLEFHKYLFCNRGSTVGTQGCGPFVAVASSQDKVLSGVAMGLMYGRKSAPTDPDGFSLGLGVILDANVRSLAKGFVDGSPPPGGETEIRFRSEARWSGVLFVSRTF